MPAADVLGHRWAVPGLLDALIATRLGGSLCMTGTGGGREPLRRRTLWATAHVIQLRTGVRSRRLVGTGFPGEALGSEEVAR
jgi:hypothetical protein